MTQAVNKLTLLTNGGIQSRGQSLIARTEIANGSGGGFGKVSNEWLDSL